MSRHRIKALALGIVLGAILSVGLAIPASAATYYLDNVVFSDGSKATGSFTTNVSGYLDNWSITTTSAAAFPGHLYTQTINADYTPGGSTISFYYDAPSYGGYLHLVADGPIDAIAGSAALLAGSGECKDYSCIAIDPDFRSIVSGAISLTPPAAVPEPASWALIIIGFGAIGMVLRRAPTRRGTVVQPAL